MAKTLSNGKSQKLEPQCHCGFVMLSISKLIAWLIDNGFTLESDANQFLIY